MRKFYKLTTVLLLIALIMSLAACGENPVSEEYGDPAEYAGIWHSAPGDDRAFVLYEDGKYELYSVRPGEAPELKEDGEFKPRGGQINLFQQGSDAIWGQLHVSYDEITFTYEFKDFTKITDETDKASLEELTVISVPLDRYLGEWENDTVYMQFKIEADSYAIIREDGTSTGGTFLLTKDYLLIGIDNLKVTATEDGKLKLEGTDGTFYPKGSGKGAASPFAPLAGTWSSAASGWSLEIKESGEYILVKDEGFSAGDCSFKNGSLYVGDYAAAVTGGKLVLSGGGSSLEFERED